jgi:transcription factor SPN1
MEDQDPNAPVPGVDAPLPGGGLPEAGSDPGDPLAPEVEEENEPDAPIASPYQDAEVTGENEVDKDDLSDNESLLSDVDEEQFQDFDPAAISLEDRQQIAIDDDNVKLLGVHKRKRTEGEVDEARKKKKEKRRDKSAKKARRRRDGSEPFSGGEEIDGKRRRRRAAEDGEAGSSQRKRDEIDESMLPPEERKRRDLDRRMDEALRSGKSRISKKDGIVSLRPYHVAHDFSNISHHRTSSKPPTMRWPSWPAAWQKRRVPMPKPVNAKNPPWPSYNSSLK